MLVLVVIANKIKMKGKIMKLCNISIKTLFHIAVIFGYTSQTYAEDIIPTMKMLWQKEITADANLNCSLGPVAFDETTKKLLITGTSFRPKSYSEGKFWLIEVDINSGDITKKRTIKKVNKSKATLMLASSLIRSLVVSENSDITLVGRFEDSVQSIMKTSRNENTSKFIELAGKNNDRKNSLLVHGGINLPNDNFLLIGGDGKADGIVVKVDSEGNWLWEKSYKIGQKQVDLCIDGLPIAGKEDFLIVGCSTNVKGKFPEETSDDFILLCNAQGDVIAKNIFTANPGE